jgi:hypothetical protein
MEKYAGMQSRTVELLIPYSEGSMVSTIYGSANEVVEEQYREDGIHITAEVDDISYGRLSKYIIS